MFRQQIFNRIISLILAKSEQLLGSQLWC